jgi:hypothetical protein
MTSLENLNLDAIVNEIILDKFSDLEIPNETDEILQRLVNLKRNLLNSEGFLIQFGLTPKILFYDCENPEFKDKLSKLRELRILLDSKVTGQSVESLTERLDAFEKLTQRKLF